MKIALTIFIGLFLISCAHQVQDPSFPTPQEPLVNINIVDRNGMSETVSSKDRLKTYDRVDFLSGQPYARVLRVWAKDKSGKSFSVITSYHPNGQIKQYLEVVNGRAYGHYVEWHLNGQKKIDAHVVGGVADIDEKSQATWAFDGTSHAWDEDGHLLARVSYSKGELAGKTTYYHVSGAVKKEIPYVKGQIEGEAVTFDQIGNIIEKTAYHQGLQWGRSTGFWQKDVQAWTEDWKGGLLQQGSYYNRNGTARTPVRDGVGFRSFFEEGVLTEIQQYVGGKQEGEVKCLHGNRVTIRYHVLDGVKHGEEIHYWFGKKKSLPKLSMQWHEGQLQGTVKTWYENGTLESSREMSQNKKQGHFLAWYLDGSLMMLEEYDRDILKRGEYLKKGDKTPVSKVINGLGIATFFDKEGSFLKKVTYAEGRPQDEDA